MIKAAIFDHDGVIVDTESYQQAAWSEVFKEYGIVPSAEELVHVKGKTRRQIIKEMFGDIDEAKVMEISQRKDEVFFALLKDNLKLIEGVTEALKIFKKRGLKTALASSSVRHKINFTFSLFDIKKYFDLVMTAEDVGNGKPDPEIYLQAARQLGVEPSECIVFEDSFAGVLAANAAGMMVILVESSHKLAEFAQGSVNKSIVNFKEIDWRLFGLL